ncbi:MAG: hypothetical protein KGZ70_13150 [Hydrogenophaga sp.]|nr:hypothetical protein [Hydrogenophaga sp.]
MQPDAPGLTTADSSEDERLGKMWSARCATLHRAWVQVRYHRRRQRFFDLLDKLTKSATVVLGASLMGQHLYSLLPWLATSITALGLLALVFGYGDRKQTHKELAEQAAGIVADIVAVPVADLDFKKTAHWDSAYARLVAKAPPPLKTLMLICEKEQSNADGHHTLPHFPKLRWYRRWLAQFF